MGGGGVGGRGGRGRVETRRMVPDVRICARRQEGV